MIPRLTGYSAELWLSYYPIIPFVNRRSTILFWVSRLFLCLILSWSNQIFGDLHKKIILSFLQNMTISTISWISILILRNLCVESRFDKINLGLILSFWNTFRHQNKFDKDFNITLSIPTNIHHSIVATIIIIGMRLLKWVLVGRRLVVNFVLIQIFRPQYVADLLITVFKNQKSWLRKSLNLKMLVELLTVTDHGIPWSCQHPKSIKKT